MFKDLIIDFYDDSDNEIIKSWFDGEPNRDYAVKVASEITTKSNDEVNSLLDSQFALVAITKEGSVERKFPLDSPNETWLSATYFSNTANDMPKEAAIVAAVNISESAKVQNVRIDDGIHKLARLYPGVRTNSWIETNAEDDSYEDMHFEQNNIRKLARDPNRNNNKYWGLVVNDQLRYPLKTEEHVKIARNYFDKNHSEFLPEERHEFANRIVARSLEYGLTDVSKDETLMKYAGVDFGSKVNDSIKQRIEFLDTGSINEYLNLTKSAEELGATQFAIALSEIDRRNGLSRYWDNGINDPYHTTFGNYIKTASEKTTELDGKIITEKELSSIDNEKFRKLFGETLLASFKKDPIQIFDSLPKPERRSIVEMIN